MASQFQNLLKPLQMGDLELRNRVVMASLTRNRDNVPRENLHVPYYAERAGNGLILSEAALICPQGVEWTYMPGIYSQDHVAGWKKVTDAVHERGGIIFCQLHHVGRVAHPGTRVQRESGQPVPGPSAIAARGGKFRNVPGGPGYVTPTAIEDPEAIIELYSRASQLAKEAGFDGVELHNANGYLPMQFLEAHSNRREDEWGGSLENRMKFSLACLAKMNEHFPYNRIGIKLAPCGGYNDMGELDADGNPSPKAALDTYGGFCAKLDTLGLAYAQIMRWWASYDLMINGKPRGVQWDPISALRPVLRNTLLFGNTAFTAEEADDWIGRGLIDAVVIGRPLLYNPDYVEKLESGQAHTIYQEQPGDEYWWYKWRNNDKKDGYLNWANRTIIPSELTTTKNRANNYYNTEVEGNPTAVKGFTISGGARRRHSMTDPNEYFQVQPLHDSQQRIRSLRLHNGSIPLHLGLPGREVVDPVHFIRIYDIQFIMNNGAIRRSNTLLVGMDCMVDMINLQLNHDAILVSKSMGKTREEEKEKPGGIGYMPNAPIHNDKDKGFNVAKPVIGREAKLS